MTQARVRVLLDVDGVLNAVPGYSNHWTDWQRGVANGFHITWSPSVAKFFCELSETSGVEVLWLTTWGEKANKYICPLLGIPNCVVAGEMPRTWDRWWKFDIAKQLWNKDQIPFVWIDDDLATRFDSGAARWVSSLDDHALGIRPSLETGLTGELLAHVSEFIDGWLESEKDDIAV